MVKKIFYSIIFTLFVFLPFRVNAYVNTDFYYSFNIYTEDFDFQFTSDYTYKQILDYFTNYTSDFYNIMVQYNEYDHRINLGFYPKSYTLSYSNYIDNNRFYLAINSPSNTSIHHVNLILNTNYSFENSSSINKIKNCLDTNICWSSSTTVDGNSFYNYPYIEDIRVLDGITNNITNDSSYTLENYSIFSYIYSSQVPILANYTNISNYVYTKKLIINGVEIEQGDSIPTYLDLFSDTDNYKYSLPYLNDYKIGGIPKNSISNLKIDFQMQYESQDYFNSLNVNYKFYGRINHNDYYSFEEISCNPTNALLSRIYSDDNIGTLSIFPDGVSCSSSLTNYDSINVYLYFNSDGIYNSFLHDVRVSYLLGYGTFKGHYPIYQKSSGLSDNLSILFSTTSNSTNVEYISSNKNTVLVPVDRNNNRVGQSAFDDLSFGALYNTNAMIFNIPDGNVITTDLDLFMNSDVIYSYKSVNDTYTYYDSTNTLTTTSIDNNIIISHNKYNIDFYDSIVANYIATLSEDIYQFSSISQLFYDNLPPMFQSFIYVCFILICFYFVYLIIKRR